MSFLHATVFDASGGSRTATPVIKGRDGVLRTVSQAERISRRSLHVVGVTSSLPILVRDASRPD